MTLLLGKDECGVVYIIVYNSIFREQNILLLAILLLYVSKLDIDKAYIVAFTQLINGSL